MTKSLMDDKDLLQEVVNCSKTVSECVTKLGFRTGHANDRFKMFCEKHEIDISHLQYRGENNSHKTRRSDDEVFVKNSTYENRRLLKLRMVRMGIPYACKECGISDTWNGKPLNLTLDHINGIYNDNRLENLCFLCPNCHSQTSTYCGRNVKKRKIMRCKKCGNLSGKNKYCSDECRNTHSERNKDFPRRRSDGSIIDRPTREDLIKTLRDNNCVFLRVAKIYNVSDNAVRKWCIKHGIPTKKVDLKKFMMRQFEV